jgi:hypothetical protein
MKKDELGCCTLNCKQTEDAWYGKKGTAAKLVKLLMMTFAYPFTCYQYYANV